MALIPCPKCGNTISEYAETCPHCGHPLQQDRTNRRARATLLLIGAAVVAAVIALSLALVGRRADGREPADQPTPAINLSEMPTVAIPDVSISLPSVSLPSIPLKNYTAKQQQIRALAAREPLSLSEISTRLRRQGWSMTDILYNFAGCDVDWKSQAARRAAQMMQADESLTPEALYDRLIAAEFNAEQAQYGVDNWKNILP